MKEIRRCKNTFCTLIKSKKEEGQRWTSEGNDAWDKPECMEQRPPALPHQTFESINYTHFLSHIQKKCPIRYVNVLCLSLVREDAWKNECFVSAGLYHASYTKKSTGMTRSLMSLYTVSQDTQGHYKPTSL